jgi:hypothetical protein
LAAVDVRIDPQPTEDERRAILAALAAGGRTLPAPSSVEDACVVDVKNTPLDQPTNPSAPSA